MDRFRKTMGVILTVVMLAVTFAACAELQLVVTDSQGRTAELTAFRVDGGRAWWAQLPEDSDLSRVSVQLAEDNAPKAPAQLLVVPDAGDSPENAAYVTIGTEEALGQARLYVSRQAFALNDANKLRNVRAVGQWGRISGRVTLLDAPDTAAETLGTLETDTRFYVLYTCRGAGVDYVCIRAAGRDCYIRASGVKLLSAAADLAYDAPLLSGHRSSGDVRFASTAYPANLRRALGSSSDTVIGVMPKGTLVLVLTKVSLNKTDYALVYRMDTGATGFVHDSQLETLRSADAAAAIGGEAQSGHGAAAAASDTTLRAYPAADAQPVLALKAGDEVRVYTSLDTPDGRFSLVSAGSQFGYMLTADLGGVTAAEGMDAAVVSGASLMDAYEGSLYEVVVREAVIYAEPRYQAAAVTRVEAGDCLTCLETQEGWIRVSASDTQGWLPASFAQALRLGATEDQTID